MANKPQSSPESKPALWQTILTYLAWPLAFLLILSFTYPGVMFNGKVINQHDISSYKGMAKETVDFREKTGKEALWVSTLFSGMPAYQTSVRFEGNLFRTIDQIFTFGLPRPVNYFFLTFLGFYFLLLTLGINPWLSGIGALAYALSSYFLIIHVPGHTSKAGAIAYMAPVVAGILMTYRGKLLLGAAITGFFLALEIKANHYQITYYLAITVGILVITYAVQAVREKTLPDFVKSSLALLIVAILAVGPNLGKLWSTYEYQDVTMRGKAELSGATETGSGLNKEYALRWSYGISETITLLIPNFYGGSSTTPVDNKSELGKTLRRQFQQQVNVVPAYWGDQPGTSGPVYVGAIVCFLFILGLFLIKGPMKWWIIAATALTVMLSWGKNFLPLTDVFFNYFPLYNKFRAVSMLLVIAEFTMPLLGFFALHKIISDREKLDMDKVKRALLIAGGITGGLSLLMALIGPSLLSFEGPADGSYPAQFMDIIVDYRVEIFRNDAFRSFMLVGLSLGLIWFHLTGKVKENVLYGGLAVLVLFDMLQVGTRFLNDDNRSLFVSKRNYDNQFVPTPADQAVLNDKDPNYRVFNFAGSPFENAIPSYHHKSIGGYHAAKLRRYSDMINRHFMPEVQAFANALQSTSNITDSILQANLAKMTAFNMLNTRYLITNPNGAPIRNRQALGNAWFVSQIQEVNNADEEIAALGGSFNPSQTAIIDKRFVPVLNGFTASADPTARIRQTDTESNPRHLTYEATTSKDMLAVFSEIYYEKGWNAYIDGEKVDHVRVDYILRGLVIPSGTHKVEFIFEPRSYSVSRAIAWISSLILILGLGGVLFLEWKNRDVEVV